MKRKRYTTEQIIAILRQAEEKCIILTVSIRRQKKRSPQSTQSSAIRNMKLGHLRTEHYQRRALPQSTALIFPEQLHGPFERYPAQLRCHFGHQ